MHQQNSDKEKYTIDEMMGHLKKRQSGEAEPELVTRSDGSQALKVKKRKRRTDQTANKDTQLKKRIQIGQIAGAVLLLTILVLVVGVGIIFVNSAGYRESLTSKLEISSGAKVDMEQFRMNPLAANTRKATLQWPLGNVLDKFELLGVTAKISPSSFVGRSFTGDEILAESAKLLLKAPDPSKPLRHVPKSEDGLSVKFSRYAVSSLDIKFGGIGALTKTEASMFPATVTGQSEMRFSGGTLQLSAWPALLLDRSYIKIRNPELQIQSMRFQLPESDRQSLGGCIDFSGTLSPVDAAGTQVLSAKLEDFPLSYLVGVDLGRFFVGKVDSVEIPDSNFLSFDIDAPETAKLESTVTKAEGGRVDMSGFKFLQMLAVAFNDRWYEFPVFDDDVTMVIKRMGENTSMSDLNLVKRGRMVVRGDFFNGEGGAIKGKLRIGIPETTLIASGDKKLIRMFGQLREGYRWVDIEISGTGALPDDNFRTIYTDTSSGESAAPGQTAPRDSFEDLIENE
ncbi:MAG: hypothetical protein RLZZ505_2114 [Verrucomicrobiota bacterium]|jgi:hypothetical protein